MESQMPELPDIRTYADCLNGKAVGQTLEGSRIASPFVLRSVDPPLSALHGRALVSTGNVGKRLLLSFDGDFHLVIHLMIAGRLHWKPEAAPLKGKQNLAAFDFPNGTLTLTEAGSKKRASLHVVKGMSDVRNLDPGGIDVLESGVEAFERRLRERNHTVKRALTDPTIFSGIGNAYSDEILHRAGLSPLLWTSKLEAQQVARLFATIRDVMEEWIERLGEEAATNDGWPKKVTAFRKEMAVHGRFGLPCPSCGSPVQRIAYANNETNYCPTCQTDGVLLADRSMSRLLKSDWPRSLEELEELKRSTRDQ